ncbi:hypothetical protein BHE74_00001856 [Ensete ventricosum]|uniref:glucose-1-phosphate adenylyltransferase n=1 Tax=Ensete ventricosum TaxID=4639 RepID=A0A427A3Q8_ENSVE|nr:hypothetical protein B296_00008983 [Ensete ventricosum]RWW89179.1 hypothetical protein BHE74_00001856 [Ensete ventricosum]RZR81570.1 hypothetical protein BHM03_00007826 [Ensete ventricosum]
MSNCINSGINKVYILTQFNSASLNRHLARAYNFSNGVSFGDGFVETSILPLFSLQVLAATQTPGVEGKRWFQGTADAVRQFHWLFEEVDTTVLGLSKEEAAKNPYIASMGVYVFKKELLLNLLRYDSSIQLHLVL